MFDHFHFSELLPQTKAEAATDAIAAAAMSSPFWWPLLKETSEVFALLLPIAGVVWLVVQIIAKIYLTRKLIRSAVIIEQQPPDEAGQ